MSNSPPIILRMFSMPPPEAAAVKKYLSFRISGSPRAMLRGFYRGRHAHTRESAPLPIMSGAPCRFGPTAFNGVRIPRSWAECQAETSADKIRPMERGITMSKRLTSGAGTPRSALTRRGGPSAVRAPCGNTKPDALTVYRLPLARSPRRRTRGKPGFGRRPKGRRPP